MGESGPVPECLTCDLQEMMPSLSSRPRCQFVDISMSKGGSYYTMSCKGPGIPYSCLHLTETNSLLSVWEDNAVLETIYSHLDGPVVRYLQVPVPGTDQKAQVKAFSNL